MEGVGARLGRSSTRYGPATVFTGPVRKWKKKWVHVSPSASNKRESAVANGGAAGDANNGSHLLLFKWTPLSESNNGGNSNGNGNGSLENNSPGDDAAAAAGEEPPKRRFKYVPIAFLEEQKTESPENEDAEKIDEEAKPDTTEASIVDLTTQKDTVDEKPDINDIPMEENQDESRVVRQDLNESTLDLSLNLNADDGEPENEQST